LLNILQRAHRPNRRIRTITRLELSLARHLKATLGVFSSGEDAGTGREGGFLARFEMGMRDVEDELVAVWDLLGGHCKGSFVNDEARGWAAGSGPRDCSSGGCYWAGEYS